jgi:hypothetical protein
LDNGISESLDECIWNSLSDESEFKIHFFANDSAGNLNDLYDYIIFRDIITPQLSINSPNNQTYWDSAPIINITVIDEYLDRIWYTIKDQNFQIENNTENFLNSEIWDSLSDECEFKINFYANDSAGNFNDIYSLILYKDVLAPFITINFPDPYDKFGNIAPNYDLSVSGMNLVEIWYTLDNGINNYTITEFNGSVNQEAWDDFGNETVIIIFYAKDILGHTSSKEVSVIKDIYAPIITIESPESDEVFGFESPTFKIYIDGSDLDATWYTLDNGVTNHSFTGLTGKINQESWAQFGNGTVLVKFYVNDSLGNIDSQEIVVRKDIIDPIIDILEPNAYDLYGNDIPAVILDVNEPNLYYMWYSLEDGTEFTDNYTWTGVISQSVWEMMGNGTVRINFYAEDLGNNLGTNYIIVKKDIIAPVQV